MAFDGLFTRAITHEIANSLYTGRISKIYQPSKYEILLHIRANGKNQKLILLENDKIDKLLARHNSKEHENSSNL